MMKQKKSLETLPVPFRLKSSSARPPICPIFRRQTPSPRHRYSPQPETKVKKIGRFHQIMK